VSIKEKTNKESGALWRATLAVFVSVAMVLSLMPTQGLGAVSAWADTILPDTDETVGFVMGNSAYTLADKSTGVSVSITADTSKSTTAERSVVYATLKALTLSVEQVSGSDSNYQTLKEKAEAGESDTVYKTDALYRLTLNDTQGSEVSLSDALKSLQGATVTVSLPLSSAAKEFINAKTDANKNAVVVYDLNEKARTGVSDFAIAEDGNSLTFTVNSLGDFGVVCESLATQASDPNIKYTITNETPNAGDNYIDYFSVSSYSAGAQVTFAVWVQSTMMCKSVDVSWIDAEGTKHVDTLPVTMNDTTYRTNGSKYMYYAHFVMPAHDITVVDVSYVPDDREFPIAITMWPASSSSEAPANIYKASIYSSDGELLDTVDSIEHITYYDNGRNSYWNASSYSISAAKAKIGDKLKLVIEPISHAAQPKSLRMDGNTCTYNELESKLGYYVYDIEVTENAADAHIQGYYGIVFNAVASYNVVLPDLTGGSVETITGDGCPEGNVSSMAYFLVKPNEGGYIKSITCSYDSSFSDSFEPVSCTPTTINGDIYYRYGFSITNDVWLNVEFDSYAELCDTIEGMDYCSDGTIAISTESGLIAFANAVNEENIDFYGRTVKLSDNIELHDTWTPIGKTIGSTGNSGNYSWKTKFRGTFDGCGKSITNMAVYSSTVNSSTPYAGLFGNVEDAVIKNVNVSGIISLDSSPNAYVGGIAGRAESIINCTSDVAITLKREAAYVGGVVGYADSVSDCVHIGNILADFRSITDRIYAHGKFGGVAGYISSSAVECGNYGDITIYGNRQYTGSSTNTVQHECDVVLASVGGVVAQVADAGRDGGDGVVISSSFNKGNIIGHFVKAGGIVGCSTRGKMDITDCYNTGRIDQTAEGELDGQFGPTVRLGGIVGCTNLVGTATDQNSGGELNITNCYSTTTPTCNQSYTYMGIGSIEANTTADRYNGLGTTTITNSYGPDELTSANIAKLLESDAYVETGLYPVLKWEPEDTGTYKVTFNISAPDGVAWTLTLKDSNCEAVSSDKYISDGGYWYLPAGTYTYEVSASGYVTENGTIQVGARDSSVSVELKEAAELSVTVSPATANLSVDFGGVATAPTSTVVNDDSVTFNYVLYKGRNYTYTATADGYVSAVGAFSAGYPEKIEVSLRSTARESGSSDITAGQIITKGGVYYIASGSTGMISIETTDPVTLCGTGITSNDMYSELSIKCEVSNTHLTLRDLYIQDNATVSTTTNTVGISTIDFTGSGNTLDFEGVNLFESMSYADAAVIHVDSNTSLTVGSSSEDGTLYMYRTNKGSGFGGSVNETCGSLEFVGGNVFIKGSKTGACIGGDATSGTNGNIVISGGTLNIVNKANGAAIGASSQGTCAGKALITGGDTTIISDYQGSAIGRGGATAGNAGTLEVTGGSLKVVRTGNSTSENYDSATQTLDDTSITADKGDLSLFVFTPKSESVAYGFTDDDLSGFASVVTRYGYTESTVTTIANWSPVEDSSVYLYLDKTKSYVLYDGNDIYDVAWDSDTSSFVATLRVAQTPSSITVTDEDSDTLTSTSALTVTKNASAEAVGASKTYSVSATAGLTPTASSSDESVATASIEDGKLTVTAKSAGIAKITVSAEETSTLEAPESVELTVAVAEVSFLGGSLRIDDGNGLATTDYTKTSLRLGYTVKMPTNTTIDGETVEVSNTSWGWSYGLSGDKLNYTRQGENKTDNGDGTFTTNIVFTNIGAANYTSALFASMNLSATVNGQTLNWSESEVDTRSVQSVAQAVKDSSSESEQAHTYADGLLSKIVSTNEVWTDNH
jgi:hypothetical protein